MPQFGLLTLHSTCCGLVNWDEDKGPQRPEDKQVFPPESGVVPVSKGDETAIRAAQTDKELKRQQEEEQKDVKYFKHVMRFYMFYEICSEVLPSDGA